jgi:hypothetical protein
MTDHAKERFQYELDSRISDTPWEWWEYYSDRRSGWIGHAHKPLWSPLNKYRRKADAPPQWRSIELDPPPEGDLVHVCDEGDVTATVSAFGGAEWGYWMPLDKPKPPQPKPKTIRIGEYDVPEPCREPLVTGTRYYVAYLGNPNDPFCFRWNDYSADNSALDGGVVHLDKEAAILHAKALLSLTAMEGE